MTERIDYAGNVVVDCQTQLIVENRSANRQFTASVKGFKTMQDSCDISAKYFLKENFFWFGKHKNQGCVLSKAVGLKRCPTADIQANQQYQESEMQKAADMADISVLFFPIFGPCTDRKGTASTALSGVCY